MKRHLLGVILILSAFGAAASTAQQTPDTTAQVLDTFETLEAWEAHPSDGVRLDIRSDSGRTGRAMRLDFDFQGRGGYASARRSFGITFPENYEFSFWIRGNALPNTVEFKLSDQSGDNVWWHTRPRFRFPTEWQRITIKRRHISYAWGPLGGGEIRHAARLELVITAAQGGRGSVWIDDLTFRRREPDRPYDLTPRATSSAGSGATAVLDTAPSAWGVDDEGAHWLALDFLRPREFGGLVIEWTPGRHATDYVIETSDDGARWSAGYAVRGGNGGTDLIHLPESEARHLRLRLERSAGVGGYAIRALDVKPVDWAPTANGFLREVALRAPPGSYPRFFADQQVYWTVLGVSGDGRRGLLNEDGALETTAAGYSIEPFLWSNGEFFSWNEVRRSQRLERGDLPIPTVEWTTKSGLGLSVTAFAAGTPGAASILGRYRVSNGGPHRVRVTLYLAFRPFQVNPPWQFLGTPGGAAEVRTISYHDRRVELDSHIVRALTPPNDFGVSALDRGGIVEHLRKGTLPSMREIIDSTARASAALAYTFELAPRGANDVWVEAPLYPSESPAEPLPRTRLAASSYGEQRLTRTVRQWSSQLDRVQLHLPPSGADLTATIRANLAYILINRDGPALQPGARSYRRAWIRDGAMISAALLRLRQWEAVKSFLEWYAPYQYPNGKVPCCVDARGADPVPENDSHGQLIYLAMENFRHTGDTATLARTWPYVTAAAKYIDSLRQSRLTPAYEQPDSLAFRGLVPPSISHEGYSAKPMHSYWDDFYTLKGLKDGAEIARVLGKADEHARLASIRDAFRRDLYASIGRAMAMHRIDFIPGSVELGDFDATSTTIAVAPVGEGAYLPDTALRRTFERYWDEFEARRTGRKPWDGYTPYELRTVGTMLRLGWKDRAHQALQWFLGHRRPAAWRQWSEGVFRDPSTPKFIGDMPHTWVGSDFLRSVLDFFAYEEEADSTLVLGAGLAERWVREPPGVMVKDLSTYYGPLSYTMRGKGQQVVVRVADGLRVPRGGIVIHSPSRQPIRVVQGSGEPVISRGGRAAVIRSVPAEITLSY
jgi:hypothetical protein